MGDETLSGGNSIVRVSGVPIRYPLLTDTNYGIWAVKMKILMKALGVWAAIEADDDEDLDDSIDQGAMAAISQSVPDLVMMQIANCETAQEAWEEIQKLRVGEERVKKSSIQTLRRQFDRLIMDDSEEIGGFSAKLMSLVNEIRSLGGELKDGVVVDRLFSAVPDRFTPIICTIEQWGDLETMSVSEAVGRLRAFDQSLRGRKNGRDEERGEQLLMVTRSQIEKMISEGRIDDGGRNERTHRKFDKSKIKCFNCDEMGHFASECRKPRREKANLVIEEDVFDEPALL
ncbi:Retrovirus-related Pol polyprotein from transposon TNT 1-94 [Linum perenne]